MRRGRSCKLGPSMDSFRGVTATYHATFLENLDRWGKWRVKG